MQKKLLLTLAYCSSLDASPPAAKEALGLRPTVDIQIDSTVSPNLGHSKAQDSLTARALKLGIIYQNHPEWQIKLGLDPLSGPDPIRNELPFAYQGKSPAASKLYPIDRVYFANQFRPHLKIAIERVAGTTRLVNLSKLVAESYLEDEAWYQMAISAQYDIELLKGLYVKLLLGNGEGEDFRNGDGQQYGGLEIDLKIIQGLGFKLGLSFDGNNSGSSQAQFILEDPQNRDPDLPTHGFSTERLGISLYLDESFDSLMGLSLTLGFQQVKNQDLSDDNKFFKDSFSYENEANTRQLRLSDYFLESGSGRLTKSLYQAGFNYKILAEYFIGGFYGYKNIKSHEGQAFSSCLDLSTNECKQQGKNQSRLGMTAWGAGFGIKRDYGLKLSLEYTKLSYDKLYKEFNILKSRDQATRTGEYFNARLSYEI